MLSLKIDLVEPGRPVEETIAQYVNWHIRGVSEEIKNTAQNLAPVDSGRLQESIQVLDADGKPAQLLQLKDTAKGNVIYYVATNVAYSYEQEFGWGEKRGGFNFGTPYLRPAFYQHVRPGMMGLKRDVQRVIDDG